jgi:dTDP-4-amino-4,6-dideoxygalactose transaminase
MTIKFVDLHAQYVELKSEIDEAIASVIEESQFIRGPYVENFEEEFKNFVGSNYCVSCANGTDAIYIALKALGVKQGDEVIVPAHTWFSTSEAVGQCGAIPVFCDTTLDTYLIDPRKIGGLVTARTVGIIPVHLYGQPADMSAIMKIARKYNLWVVEDCAQAHGALVDGVSVGNFGIFGTYSFYPGKNLGAMGDAGALVTNDEAYAIKAAKFSRHGGLIKGRHEVEGINSRLDGMQAAILNCKLKRLKEWNARRTKAAEIYDNLLTGLPLELPKRVDYGSSVWHLYVIKLKSKQERDGLKSFLASRDIPSAINYPVALPFVPAYQSRNHSASEFPCAHHNQDRILSIPMHPHMGCEDISEVAESIRAYFV